MFDDIDEEIAEFIPEDQPAKSSFNKVAVRKPFYDPPVVKVPEVKRNDERCKVCGNLKQQRKEGQGKFRWVCVACKTKKRTESDRKRRNET